MGERFGSILLVSRLVTYAPYRKEGIHTSTLLRFCPISAIMTPTAMTPKTRTIVFIRDEVPVLADCGPFSILGSSSIVRSTKRPCLLALRLSLTVRAICRHKGASIIRFLVGVNRMINPDRFQQRVPAILTRLQPLLPKMLEDQRQAGDGDRFALDLQLSIGRRAAAGAAAAPAAGASLDSC